MISKFFIDRPVFAIVLSLVIVLAGMVAWGTLPVAQYPEVTPPTVTVTAFYPGANAQTVRNTVAAPIEEQVSGVENMLYMSSQCTNDGTYNLTVTFRLGMDTDMAQVLVQNRVSLALPVIPALVQNEGINVKKMSPNTMMIVNLLSPDGQYDSTFLSNYATIYIKDELGRLPGVAGITYLGQRDYSLRAWLDPAKMAALNLSATDIINAISQQNLQVAAGQIGQQPVPDGPAVPAHDQHPGPAGRARAVRVDHPQGGPGHVPGGQRAGRRDQHQQHRRRHRLERRHEVGRPGLPGRRHRPGGLEQRGRRGCRRPPASSGSATSPASSWARGNTTSPAPSTASRRWRSRSTSCPAPTRWRPPRASTPRCGSSRGASPTGWTTRSSTTPRRSSRSRSTRSINTLRDAVILVGIVVLVFLQDWKAMILPMIDVPVSLIGTFAIMAALGFSLNNLTLFGLVLAIGIVVDDAIVVLENIERLIATGLDSRTATIQAMEEITGPILAITLVLSSVFIPCCFLGGITGQFFRQFAVTIAVSTIISAINALTMTPSRAVMIFKTEDKGGHGGHELKREALPWWFFAMVGGMISARLGYDYAAAQLGVTAEGLEDGSISVWMSRAAWWAAFVAGAIPGGLVGLIIIRPVNAVLGWLFRGFNRLFDRMTNVYGRMVGGVLRVSVAGADPLRRPAGPDVLGIHPHAHGLRPAAGQGLPAAQRAVARLGLGGADQRAMARIETLARETPGVAHTVGVSGQSLLLNANAPNLGSLYVLLEPFEKRRGHRPLGRRHRRADPGTLPRRCARRPSRSSAPRRSTAWARPAASS